MFDASLSSRRGFLRGLTVGAATLGVSGFFRVPGVFAEELTKTPRQTEGPFYPTKLPLDTDNDLIIVNDSITPAVGRSSARPMTRRSRLRLMPIRTAKAA